MSNARSKATSRHLSTTPAGPLPTSGASATGCSRRPSLSAGRLEARAHPADLPTMRVAANHPVSVLVLLGAVLCTATVFVYATPQHPYRSPNAVRRAFAAHGVHLRAAASPDGVR